LFSGEIEKMAGQPQQDGQGSVTAATLAEVISQATDSPVTEADILDDVEAGAPVLSDGRISLLQYLSWLYNQMVGGTYDCPMVAAAFCPDSQCVLRLQWRFNNNLKTKRRRE
jgi:hypothetical protein